MQEGVILPDGRKANRIEVRKNMNTGKLSNSVLKRSVLKLIKKNSNRISGTAVGSDAAIVTASQSQGLQERAIGKKDGNDQEALAASVSSAPNAVYHVSNNLEASGAHVTGIVASILFPDDADEQELKKCVREVAEQCEELGITYAGGDTRVISGVSSPIISVTGFGHVYAGTDTKKEFIGAANARPAQDIILTKQIGIEGVRLLAEFGREEILTKYSADLIEKAIGDKADLSIAREAQLAIQNGVTAMTDVSEGGIFAALWNLSETAGVGMDVDLRKIPVRQEIIEICEIFDINPYELASTGCLLMTADRGCDIVNSLTQSGIDAVVIGETTDNNDKIIRHDEEVRYLDPPKRDEQYKVIK